MIDKYFKASLRDIGYEDTIEYLEDFLNFTNISLEIYNDMYIENTDIFQVQKNLKTEEFEKVMHFINSIKNFMKNRLEKTRSGLVKTKTIQKLYSLSDFQVFTFELSLLSYISSEIMLKFNILNQGKENYFLEPETAMKIYQMNSKPINLAKIHREFENNDFLSLFEIAPKDKYTSYLNYPLKPAKKIIEYIFDLKKKNYKYYRLSDENQEEIIEFEFNKEAINSVSNFLRLDTKNSIFMLAGQSGQGRSHIIENLAISNKKTCLYIDIEKLKDIDKREVFHEILRHYKIHNSVVVFQNFKELSQEIIEILEYLSLYEILVFIVSDSYHARKLGGEKKSKYNIYVEELKSSNYEDNKVFWQKALDDIDAKIKDFNITFLCNMYSFSFGDIKKILSNTYKNQIEIKSQKFLLGSEIQKEAKVYFENKLAKSLKHIKSKFRFDDLIIKDDTKSILKAAVNMLKYKDIVYGKYGLDKRLSYGKGLSILFKGAPGTGKTMAAEVIATELNMELYKVDLSKLMSKYIGETEKNIKDIFEIAKKSNIILFFDEMDALFSKRTEVSDSNDRNANLEISFLLQELEDYDGLCLLATNYLENVDDAFIRRIQFIADFALPDEERREMILRSIIGDKVPVSRDFDYAIIRNFELSGGDIKNLALSAIFDSVSEDKTLENTHLIKAIKSEYEKRSRIISKSDFGKYQIYL